MRLPFSIFRFAPRHRALSVFVLFVVLVLAIVHLGSWYLFGSLQALMESELDRYLAGVATLISSQISWRTVSQLIPGDEGTPEYKELVASLEGMTRPFDLSDVTIVDPTQKTLFSLSSIRPIGSDNAAYLVDALGVARAWAGKPSSGAAVRVGDAYLQTAFAPLRGPDGSVEAVVVVEANASFYQSVSLLRNMTYLVAVLALAGILVLAFIFRMILKRVLDGDEALQRADKLVAIGKLAAGVTHEVRNPLGIISSTAQLIQKRLGKTAVDPKILELFGYILSEIDRLDAIIARFLELAKSPGIRYESVTIGDLLAPTLSLVAGDLERDGTRFSSEVPTPDRVVEVDPGKIRQVVLNCLLNARDALRDSARKEVHVRAVVEGRDAGESLVVTIRDSGTGIPDEIRARLFEPFVTSKPTGSGIGLAMVKSILEEHRGQVTFESDRDIGTCFTLSVPTARQEVPA